jgi:hypothetical protein
LKWFRLVGLIRKLRKRNFLADSILLVFFAGFFGKVVFKIKKTY